MDGLAAWVFVAVVVMIVAIFIPVYQAQQDRVFTHKERMADIDVSVDRMAAAPRYPMLHTLNTPYTEVERKGLPAGAAAQPPVILDVPVPGLPGVTTLGQVLAQGFRPTQDAILLALGPGGQPLTASVGDDLCHIILCGQTGAGKTNTLRLLVVQLLAAGCEVYLLNPKHTSRHWRTGEDWTAIAAATRPGAAITDKAQICALIRRIHARELPKRQRLFEAGQKPGVPLFLVIDEWPAIVGWDAQQQAAAPKEEREPLLSDIMADLVRMGREYLIEILTASQDVLVDTMGGTSGDRAQFQTRYYGGGDDTSKRVLMTPQPKGGLPEPPGRGVMYLWATSTGRTPQLVRVPLVDNADIDRLLGPGGRVASAASAAPSTHGSDPFRGSNLRVVEATPSASVEVIDAPPGSDAGKRQRVRELVKQGVNSSAVIQEVWGVSGGRAYTKAADELTAILAELIP